MRARTATTLKFKNTQNKQTKTKTHTNTNTNPHISPVHPKKRVFVTASSDKSITSYCSVTRRRLKVLDAHAYVKSLAFSHDGRWLAAGLQNGKVCLGTLHLLFFICLLYKYLFIYFSFFVLSITLAMFLLNFVLCVCGVFRLLHCSQLCAGVAHRLRKVGYCQEKEDLRR